MIQHWVRIMENSTTKIDGRDEILSFSNGSEKNFVKIYYINFFNIIKCLNVLKIKFSIQKQNAV